MFGKALYEGILLPVPLAPFFVSSLQGRSAHVDDLAALDPQLHKNIVMVSSRRGGRWAQPPRTHAGYGAAS